MMIAVSWGPAFGGGSGCCEVLRDKRGTVGARIATLLPGKLTDRGDGNG